MIYPDNFEEKIGFGPIREWLNDLCLSPLGSSKVEKMEFQNTFDTINKLTGQTSEMRTICLMEKNFPSQDYYDVTPMFNAIAIAGTFPNVEDVFDLKKSLETISAILVFFKGKNNEYPLLKELSHGIAGQARNDAPVIIKAIDKILDHLGHIRDNASPELATIRRSIAEKQSTVSRTMQRIIKLAQAEGIVEEGVTPSIRDGRTVIPVNSSLKRKINGIVHDESATGRTSYIEPAELVAINNAIRELFFAEQREIVKILVAFADFLRPHIPELILAFDFLGSIDFIRAKALFAIKINAIKPIFSPHQKFEWRRAVHPVMFLNIKCKSRLISPQITQINAETRIYAADYQQNNLRKSAEICGQNTYETASTSQPSSKPREFIPLDITLTPENRLLLISGPNAGGKSVCLKTVGLIQYMFQCGLLAPMSENSEMGLFETICIDIGDEQSIDNDLSTYSSHLLNMKHFIRLSGTRTLILIDEFGSGTEPLIGGAIAEAILESINAKGVWGVITTHYSNLKHYVSSAEGIINGAMLYDSHRMQPLFRLEIGKPGSSFAFEIARNIGLPEEILSVASGKAGSQHIDFEKHLREIERDKRYWERKREDVRRHEKRLDTISTKQLTELETIEKERKAIIETARKEALQILADTNRIIENTIRTIKESQAEKEKTKEARRELNRFKEGISGQARNDEQQAIAVAQQSTTQEDHILRKIAKIKEREKRREERERKREEEIAGGITNSAKPTLAVAQKDNQPKLVDNIIRKGDTVRLIETDTIGEVFEINGKNITVTFGNLLSTINVNRLEKVSKNESKKYNSRNSLSNREGRGVVQIYNVGERRLRFKSSIDVRGERTDDAIPKVQELVDEASMLNIGEVRILHGKGNGILRQMIREYLRTSPVVASFDDEDIQQGGTGITVVKIK